MIDPSVAPPQLRSQQALIQLINNDLAHESRSLVVYLVYSQLIQGGARREDSENLEHALRIAGQMDGFGPRLETAPRPAVAECPTCEESMPFEEIELKSLSQYQRRIRQAEALGETALIDALHHLIVHEHANLGFRRPGR